MNAVEPRAGVGAPVESGERLKQAGGIRMFGLVENLIHGSDLCLSACVHHHHPICSPSDDTEVIMMDKASAPLLK